MDLIPIPMERFDIVLDFVIIFMILILLVLFFKWKTEIIEKISHQLDRVTEHYNVENMNNVNDITDSLRQLKDEWDDTCSYD